MKKEKQQTSHFELRSEKVRNIVGQVPSSIVRYGITAIGMVLLCLFIVVYFLPYKQVYSGTAIIHCVQSDTSADSITISVLLKFEDRRPHKANRQLIYIATNQDTFSGRLLKLSAIRDTLERQVTYCRFKTTEIKTIENQTVDFHIVQSTGSLLQQLLGGL